MTLALEDLLFGEAAWQGVFSDTSQSCREWLMLGPITTVKAQQSCRATISNAQPQSLIQLMQMLEAIAHLMTW